ncbi:MAG: hypothetical protein K2M16_03125, partial [Muribaculaceae bacterium]|nr:hypothetical protein [Muribaculaceae bacterium]
MTAGSSEDSVEITVGSGIADRWIAAVLSADGRILSTNWLHVENENLNVPVKAPTGNQKYMLNLNWLSDLDAESVNVNILSASSEERLKVSTESFRDKVSAGDIERWSFRFFRKSSDASEIPSMAVMTDAALNAITPFKWNFNPQPGRHPSFYYMRGAFNPECNISVVLRKITYLPYNILSFPMINDYGQDWGLNGRMYYDGGVAVAYASDMKNEVMIRGAAPQMMMKSAPAMNAMVTTGSDMEVMEEAAEAEADDAVSEEGMAAGAGNARTDDRTDMPELRETECPVAFFMPDLVSDKNGIVNVDFTVPNFNTTWAFQLLGYDSELQTAKTTLESVASKPIMVSTHAPRFVRTGDIIELTATVFNNSHAVCSPECRFELVDLISGNII